MATATTSEGGAIGAVVDVMTAIVTTAVVVVVEFAKICLQLAAACPAIAVGLGVFIGACYVPLEGTPEAIQPFLESSFPLLAGAGAAFATLMLMGGSSEASS